MVSDEAGISWLVLNEKVIKYLNHSAVSGTFCTFFERMEQNLITKIQQAKSSWQIHNQVGEEMEKHLGITKNLTLPEVNDLRDKLG